MAFDYNKYMQNYNKEKITYVSLKLNKEKDREIIELIGTENKQGKIKEILKEYIKMKGE